MRFAAATWGSPGMREYHRILQKYPLCSPDQPTRTWITWLPKLSPRLRLPCALMELWMWIWLNSRCRGQRRLNIFIFCSSSFVYDSLLFSPTIVCMICSHQNVTPPPSPASQPAYINPDLRPFFSVVQHSIIWRLTSIQDFHCCHPKDPIALIFIF